MATNLSFSPEAATPPHGRRAHSRARVALPAIVETMAGQHRAKLRNLSSSGAMLETSDGPPVGKDVVLKCFGLDQLGVVIWEEGDRCGIEFYDILDEDEVIAKRKLSDEELARARWRNRHEALEAAERWVLGKS